MGLACDAHRTILFKKFVNLQAEMLRKQLSDLKERYSRAKHAMKGAQQRLEANNRKKEEFFALQRNRKDKAIQEQSNNSFFYRLCVDYN